MDPNRSREMPSCSAIDLDEIRRSSKISSWILSIISEVVGLRTYQHPGRMLWFLHVSERTLPKVYVVSEKLRIRCWDFEVTEVEKGDV
jgi:hypothetical protein